jgi:hypothetical protein
MASVALPVIIALLLSVATAVGFWNAGMPLSPPTISVVVGFWLLVAFGVRGLWRLVRRPGKTTGS